MSSYTLKPGETFVVPPGYKIDAVYEANGGVAFSACDIPQAPERKCWWFFWEMMSPDTGPDVIESIILGSTVFPVNLRIDSNGNITSIGLCEIAMGPSFLAALLGLYGGTQDIAKALADYINNEPYLSTVMCASATEDVNGKHKIHLNVADNGYVPEIKFLNQSSTIAYPFYVKGEPSPDCEC